MLFSLIKKIRKLLYWCLPVVILIVIFDKIDLHRLFFELKNVEITLYFLALMYLPIGMFLGAMRWKKLTEHFLNKTTNLSYFVRHYWIGMSIGYFMPASIGWDVYRVIVLGKKWGQYGANVAVIITEKFLALLVCMGLILFLYPYVSSFGLPENIKFFIDIGFYVFICCIAMLFLAFLAKNNKIVHSAIEFFEKLVRRMFSSTFSKAKFATQQNDEEKTSWKSLFGPITNPRNLFIPVVLSIANMVVTGIGTHLYFEALHFEIPLIVNIFVAPIFFFIFILPISFGSIGVREGTFIFIYGLFGVPAETALLVSFLSLSGLLLNNAIGGILIYATKKNNLVKEQM